MNRLLPLARITIIGIGLALLALNSGAARPAQAAVQIQLTASDSQIGCGNQVIVTATVTDSGIAVPDGTVITFGVFGQAVGVPTAGGQASIVVSAPLGFSGPFSVTASLGTASAGITIDVVCPTAGPPATITLLVTPTTVTCGSQASVFATVRDQFGRPVADGTIVRFSTRSELGTVTPTAPVIGSGGVATAVFTAFPRSQGQVLIEVQAGTVTATASVSITCATAPAPAQAPAMQVAPAIAPTAARVASITPPSTGDAGLLGR